MDRTASFLQCKHFKRKEIGIETERFYHSLHKGSVQTKAIWYIQEPKNNAIEGANWNSQTGRQTYVLRGMHLQKSMAWAGYKPFYDIISLLSPIFNWT